MASKKTSEPIHFEKSLNELNEIVKKMEQGDLPLETSLACFEQGVQLIRHCQQALQQAEQRVQILTQQNSNSDNSLEDFHEH